MSGRRWTSPDNKKAKDVLVRFGKGSILQCQVFATYEEKNTSALDVTLRLDRG